MHYKHLYFYALLIGCLTHQISASSKKTNANEMGIRIKKNTQSIFFENLCEDYIRGHLNVYIENNCLIAAKIVDKDHRLYTLIPIAHIQLSEALANELSKAKEAMSKFPRHRRSIK